MLAITKLTTTTGQLVIVTGELIPRSREFSNVVAKDGPFLVRLSRVDEYRAEELLFESLREIG